MIRFCVNLHKHKSESGWLTNPLGPFCPPDAGRAKKIASFDRGKKIWCSWSVGGTSDTL